MNKIATCTVRELEQRRIKRQQAAFIANHVNEELDEGHAIDADCIEVAMKIFESRQKSMQL